MDKTLIIASIQILRSAVFQLLCASFGKEYDKFCKAGMTHCPDSASMKRKQEVILLDTTNMEKITQQLIEAIIESIPTEWDRIMFYGENRGDYADFFYYYFQKDSPEFLPSVEMHYILDLDPTVFQNQSEQIDALILRLVEEFKAQGQKPFTSMTLLMDDAGEASLDYGYDRLKHDRAEFHEYKFAKKYVVPVSKARGGHSDNFFKKAFNLFFN